MSVHVVISAQSQAEALVYWGAEFALARQKPLRFIIVDQGEATDTTGDLNATFQGILPSHVQNVIRERDELPEDLKIRFFRQPSSELSDALMEEIHKGKDGTIGLLLVGKEQSARHGEVDVLSRRIFQESHWRTMLIRPGVIPPNKPRILIPAGGGPHAAIALQLAGQLVARRGAVVSPLYVETNRYDDGIGTDVGHRILRKLSSRVGLEVADENVRPMVVESKDVQAAIGQIARENFDLVIIGQAGKLSARYWLFGTLAMETANPPSLAVVRKGVPLQTRLRERAAALFVRHVPQLSREERVDLFARLETSSRWNFDFIALLMLSTAIAGLGLALNSTAVVIGAMLVAPLMTPIIGASLALVQGNIPLLGTAFKAITFGFLTAMLIGVVIGLFDREGMAEGLNTELMGRAMGPGIMDLMVGLFSGLAAAYCTGRTGLSGALPGVAIAAALVPPVGTTGICLAWGLWAEAGGAAALFGINVLTIIIGAALALLLTGVKIRKGRIFALLFGGMSVASILIGIVMWFR